MNNNKKIGSNFEISLSEYLSYKGFWVQLIKQNQDGQSSDLLAIKGGKAYLIDAKVCSNKFFDIERIEENQLNSMKKFKTCGNEDGLFALWIDKQDIWIVTLDDLLIVSKTKNKRCLSKKDLEPIAVEIQQWVDEIRL